MGASEAGNGWQEARMYTPPPLNTPIYINITLFFVLPLQVRWADIEEKRAQQKMRAIGFVVGQTDWKRMMDPNAGNRALNKTKYIERVNKRR